MRREWLEAIAALPIEQQDKIIADVVRYGAEVPLAYEDDPNVVTYVNLLRGRIDANKGDYARKKENGKTNGRKKIVNSTEVYRLAQNGLSAKEVAAQLGVGVDSIYHNDGWRNRTNPKWFGL